jgi:hypothetical protein
MRFEARTPEQLIEYRNEVERVVERVKAGTTADPPAGINA